MKSILLKLKDKDFFRLLRIKNKITYSVEKSITWEEFILILAKRRLIEANGN